MVKCGWREWIWVRTASNGWELVRKVKDGRKQLVTTKIIRGVENGR